MIEELDESIRSLLVAELPLKNGEVDISFDQPKREWSSRLSKPTINLFLYDLKENPTLRSHQWEEIPAKVSGDGRSHQKRTPFRVDCYYMLTTWASEPDDEHRLLSRCMMTLFRYPTLPINHLVGILQNQPFDIPARLAAHDRLTNPAEIWASMDNEMRPSISYIITLAIDPWTEVTGPIVRSLTLRTGETRSLPEVESLLPTAVNLEMSFIGGRIFRKKGGIEPPIPLVGIEVAIKGSGLFSTTDNQGKFILGSLIPGKYTLVIWLENDRVSEKQITVPPTGDGYDVFINE